MVHPKGLLQSPLPPWITPFVERCAEWGEGVGLYGSAPPNHVLVNAYLPGQGILVGVIRGLVSVCVCV